MKRLGVVLFLIAGAAAAQQPSSNSAMMALDPNGNWRYLVTDSTGDLVVTSSPVTGPSSQQGQPSQYVAIMAKDPSGTWRTLSVDSSGNLMTLGGGVATTAQSLTNSSGTQYVYDTGNTDTYFAVFQICQPASGGPYTWAWPAAVHGGVTIGTTASACSVQAFDSFSGSTLVAESAGVTNVAP